MTATETPTTETPSGQPPVRPQLGVVSAAGFIVLAATALILWLLTINSQPVSVMPTSAAASAPQAVPASGQGSASWNTGSVDTPAAYLMFCENSPALCGAPAPLAAYLQFCWNSPTLCTLPKPS
jgi:hypothetical protein